MLLPSSDKCGVLPCRSHALDSRHSASVVHYMLEVLPELHDNSSTSAASLLLHSLTSSAAPAQLLQAAVALLNKLPLTEDPSAAPSGSQLQLACALLQSFTAEAFQALPKGKGKAKGAVSPIVAGLEVLLRLVRFGATPGDGQPAEMLRLAAFKQLGAELYDAMPVRQQMETFLVSAGPHCCCSAASNRFVFTMSAFIACLPLPTINGVLLASSCGYPEARLCTSTMSIDLRSCQAYRDSTSST